MKPTENEQSEPLRKANARKVCADSGRHARLILLLTEGLARAEIQIILECGDSYTKRWSKRIETNPLDSLLCDISVANVTRWLSGSSCPYPRVTRPMPPRIDGHATRSASGGGISHMAMARIQIKHCIKPH